MGEDKAPLRALICGSVIEGWTQASAKEKHEIVFPGYLELHRKWQALGARLVGTLDDRWMTKGAPGSHHHNWYEFYEVRDLDTLSKMMDLLETREGEVNLYKYFRFEVILGPPVRKVEETVGSLILEAAAMPGAPIPTDGDKK